MICKHKENKKMHSCECYRGRVAIDQHKFHQKNDMHNKLMRNEITDSVDASLTKNFDLEIRCVDFLESLYHLHHIGSSELEPEELTNAFKENVLEELDLYCLNIAFFASQYYQSCGQYDNSSWTEGEGEYLMKQVELPGLDVDYKDQQDYFDVEVHEFEIPAENSVTESLSFLDHLVDKDLQSLQNILASSNDTNVIEVDLQMIGNSHLVKRWDNPKDSDSQSMPFTQGIDISPIKGCAFHHEPFDQVRPGRTCELKGGHKKCGFKVPDGSTGCICAFGHDHVRRDADIMQRRHVGRHVDTCQKTDGTRICSQGLKDGSTKCLCLPGKNRFKRNHEFVERHHRRPIKVCEDQWPRGFCQKIGAQKHYLDKDSKYCVCAYPEEIQRIQNHVAFDQV